MCVCDCVCVCVCVCECVCELKLMTEADTLTYPSEAASNKTPV